MKQQEVIVVRGWGIGLSIAMLGTAAGVIAGALALCVLGMALPH